MKELILKLKYRIYHLLAAKQKMGKWESAKPKLALVTVVKNEGSYLKEWIEHYRDLGVEKIIIVDNWSTDNTLEVLEPFITTGLVECYNTEDKSMSSYLQAEEIHKAIEHLKRQDEFNWVGVLDPDEFVVIENGELNLTEFLTVHQKSDVGAVALNWLMFGTSNLPSLDHKKPLVSQLTKRAPNDHREHHQFKPFIYLPLYYRMFNTPHVPILKGKARLVYTDGKEYVQGTRHINHKGAWINHYWYRAEDYYAEKKKKRLAFEDEARAQSIEEWHQNICNKVEDLTLAKRK